MISSSISFFSFSIAIGISIRINISISCISCINSASVRLLMNKVFVYLVTRGSMVEHIFV